MLCRSASDNRQIVDDRGGEGIALAVDGAARRCHGSGSGRCRRLLRFRTKLIEYRLAPAFGWFFLIDIAVDPRRSEEHTSDLQSLMRISYAVFCLKKRKTDRTSQL